MPEFLTEGDKIEFQPAGSWQWAAPFDGIVATRPTTARPMHVLSKQVLVGADLEDLAEQLNGKKYTTDQHKKPGKIVNAVVIVNPTSLARPCHLLGEVPAVQTTEGTFQFTCSPPASDPASGNIDALLVKSGTWKVKSDPQTLARSQC